MGPSIRIHGVSKCYRVQQGPGAISTYRTLRHDLVRLARAPFAWWGKSSQPKAQDFWALQDISFDVPHGQVMGILGRNGAGKSTLLKILSRITQPSSGQVEVYGRVGSLLEVGTGFHPELTGRENIFLSGAILGMRHREIAAKFDRIVDFAEIGPFLDTAVKRYSSGMYVRLAFAVAAHLEPEILLVDEVIAVGDATFQHRCITRMKELADGGCSLLFVSHNLDLIGRFCEQCVLLDRGQVKAQGEANEVISTYLTDVKDATYSDDLTNRRRRGTGEARFTSLQLLDGRGHTTEVIASGDDLRCLITIEATKPLSGVSLGVVVKTLQGTRILTSLTDEIGYKANLAPGIQQFECKFDKVRIRPGRQVFIDLWMQGGELLDHVEDARFLEVVELQPTGYSNRADQGAVLYDYTWSKVGQG